MRMICTREININNFRREIKYEIHGAIINIKTRQWITWIKLFFEDKKVGSVKPIPGNNNIIGTDRLHIEFLLDKTACCIGNIATYI